jgi:hypothetical protein
MPARFLARFLALAVLSSLAMSCGLPAPAVFTAALRLDGEYIFVCRGHPSRSGCTDNLRVKYDP